MVQVNYRIKLSFMAGGILTALACGFALILNCSIFRWALQPCVGSSVYSPVVYNIIMVIGGLSYIMIVLGWILPAKPVRDDYKSPLGQD